MEGTEDLQLVNLVSGERIAASVRWKILQSRRCRVELTFGDESVEGEHLDCFAAFCEVRKQLERQQLRPVCYGASINVWPSHMCRDMENGLRAYRMRAGGNARADDLVPIFETGPDVEPASVEEQEQWFLRWLRAGDS